MAQPTITSFSPISGPVGTAVTITGTNFSSTAANNIVYFGAVQSVALSATQTTLITKVPIGASYLPITVTTAGLTAYSESPFVLTFSSGGVPFSPGSFAAPTSNVAGFFGISVADLDGDGKPDLITGTRDSSGFTRTFSVLRNTSTSGSVSFAPKTDFSSGSVSLTNIAADLDGDGKLDVILGCQSFYSVFRNISSSPAILFAPGVNLPTTRVSFPQIIVGDLEGDGKPDIVSMNTDTTISVFKNTGSIGTISFTKVGEYGIGHDTSLQMALGDLDGDGKPDLVVTTNSGLLLVFRNTSAGGIISFALGLTIGSMSWSSGIAIGDLDGDGKADLVGISGNTSILVFRNTSTIGAISFAPVINFVASVWPTSVAIADLDGDGRPDIAVGSSSSSSVSVLRNTCSVGTISFDPKVDYPCNRAFSIAIGDIDGDGVPDISVVNELSNIASIQRNQMSKGFAPEITHFAPSSGISGDTVILSGAHFTGTQEVSFGGIPATSINIISDSSISVIIDTGATGSVSVTTISGIDTLAGFIYGRAPVLSSFGPIQATTGSTISIKGKYLLGADSVFFGNTIATSFTVVSDSLVTAVMGGGASGFVKVATPIGTDSLSGFTYIIPPPIINSFTPISGTTGTTIFIKGKYLSGTDSASFGDTAASFTVVSDSLVTAVVGAGASGFVKIITPNGTDFLAGFTYLITQPSPIINSFTPDSGTNGTIIHISGKYLNNTNAVSFGGTAASSFTVLNDSAISAIVGLGMTGFINITTPAGVDSLAGFTFILPPALPLINSFSPLTAGNGATMNIYGNHFTSTSAVSFGGTAATSFSVTSDTTITAILGAGASGFVRVTTGNGTDSMSNFIYNKQTPPPAFSLIQFTGTLVSNQVQLQWESNNEQSIYSYIVQSSLDSILFSAMGTLLVQSPDSGILPHNFTDSLPKFQINYYRLEIIDTLGGTNYSKIVVVRLPTNAQPLKIFPNPATSYVIVQHLAINSTSQIELIDMTGKIIRIVQVNPNIVQTLLDLSGLTFGIYQIIWTGEGNSHTIQMLIH